MIWEKIGNIKGIPGQSIKGEKGDSIVGPPGRDGIDGKSIVGPSGRDGIDGKSIVGPSGPPGKDGSVVYHSILKPKDEMGQDGDWAFCETEELYHKIDGKWKFYRSIGQRALINALRISNNLSDLSDVAQARINLGLVAGGAGDIWVEKAGDTMTGVLTMPNGAVGAPSINFGDATTGIYRSALDEIAFAHAGVLKAKITSAGVLTLTPTAGSGAINITASSPTLFSQTIGVNLTLSGGTLQDNIGFKATVGVSAFGGAGGCFVGIATGGNTFYGTTDSYAILAGTQTGTNNGNSLINVNPSSGYQGAVYTTNLTTPNNNATYATYKKNSVEKIRFGQNGDILYYGALISGGSNLGIIENLLLWSEDISNAAWVKTAVTVTTDATADPFFGRLLMDSVSTTTSFNSFSQTVSGACAGNTYTLSFWAQVTSGTWQVTIRNSTDAEISTATFIAFTDLRYVTLTHTFSGGAAGTPKVNFQTGNNPSTIKIWGINLSKTANPIGYTATNAVAASNRVGGYIRENFLLESPQGATNAIIRVGGVQSTTNLLEFQNGSGTVQLAVSSNGRDLILDDTTGSKIGTATSQKLAFYNSTPIVQPVNTTALDTLLVNLGLRASGAFANLDTTLKPRAGTASATTAPILFTSGTNLTTPEAGAMEYDGKNYYLTRTATRRKIVLSNDAVTSDTTVANTTTETTVFSMVMPANSLALANVMRINLAGYYSTVNASDTFTMRWKIGATTILSMVSDAANVTNASFHAELFNTIRSIGAGGTFMAHGTIDSNNVGHDTSNTATTAVDTTASNTFTITIQWSAANVGNTFTSTIGFSEIL